MCEYEVNQLTNDKVITEIQNLTQNDKVVKQTVKCQGHLKVNVIIGRDLSNNVCKY